MSKVKIETTNEYFQDIDVMLAEAEFIEKPETDGIIVVTEDKEYYYKIELNSLNGKYYIVTD